MVVVSESQFGNLSSCRLQGSLLPTMTVIQEVTKKIRIKIPTKKVQTAGGKGSFEYGQPVVIVDECSHSVSASGNRNSMMNKSHDFVLCSSGEAKRDSITIKLPMPGSRKRREPSENSEFQTEKRQKIDRNISLQCGKILKTLMSHRDSWPFMIPVDPVALQIPDYFSIISHPMDLGTVKSKLQKNEYSDAEEFAADVRLIFSNAMTYNPPKNQFHSMAKQLDCVFRRNWKLLEAKWGHDRNCVKLGLCKSEKPELAEDSQKASHKRLLSGSLHTRAPKAEPAKMTSSSAHLFSGKALMKDGGSRSACSLAKTKPPSSVVNSKCGACTSVPCQCNVRNEAVNVSSSDLSSERSFGRDHSASTRDCEKEKPIFRISKSESDGAISTLDEERSRSSPQLSGPTKDAASGEVWTPTIDPQLSPQKALRAALLKSRFADTIFKAKQKTLLDMGTDPTKIKQEKERLERQQREEQAKIEAQIRAAEAASRLAENKLKTQREREREAARIALAKMERTVDIDDNQVILKDLEILAEYARVNHSFGVVGAIEGGRIRSPLERLGLFIKEDYCIGDVYEEDEEGAVLHVDGEEGEIL